MVGAVSQIKIVLRLTVVSNCKTQLALAKEKTQINVTPTASIIFFSIVNNC